MAEIYNATGKTKTGEAIRITKPVAALVISSDKKLSELDKERITVYVERADQNETICTKIPLIDFILLSTYGEAAVDTSNGFSALCELANNGSIELGENEGLRVVMENLTAAKSYKIETLEHPLVRDEALEFDTKVILDGETVREYDVDDADLVVFDNADVIEQLDLHYDNGVIVKRTLSELRAMQHDIDPIIGIGVGNNAETVIPSTLSSRLIVPLVGVESFEVNKKSVGVVNMTFQNAFDLVEA